MSVLCAALLALAPAAQAAEFGRARLLSGVGQPLRVEIPLTRLAPDENPQSVLLDVDAGHAADAALSGRVPLDTRATVQSGAGGGLVAIVVSRDPVTQPIADLGLTLRTPQGVQRRRVVLLLPPALHANVSPVSLAAVPAAAGGDIVVRRGDTAGAIARRIQSRQGYGDASIYQVLAAILRANPSAFIDGNLNRLRAGQRLSVPDAATVRAIDPAEARQLYARHMQDFAAYRARVGRVAAAVPATAGSGQAAGRVEAPAAPALPPTGRDELRLSAAQGEADGRQAQIDRLQDERAATERALADARARAGTLEANVVELKRLLEVQNAALARLQAAQAPGAADAAQAPGSAPGAASGARAAAGAGGAAGTTGSAAAGAAAGTAGDAQAAAATSAGAARVPGQQGVPGQPARAGAGNGRSAQGAAGTAGDAGGAPGAPASVAAGATGQAGNAGPATATAAPRAAAGTPGSPGSPERIAGASTASPDGTPGVQALGQDQPASPGWLERNRWLAAGLAILFVLVVLAAVFRRRRTPPAKPLRVDFDLDLDSPPRLR